VETASGGGARFVVEAPRNGDASEALA
jgi:hypothetical protein